jgi:rhodanese-related sulfurtransferase/DNA-binding transcriptional ArsR family regulator
MNNPKRIKDAVYEHLARIGKAISSPRRLELLDLLCQAPRTVEALAKEANLSVANTSQHLQTLRAARLVETDRNGLFVTYRLADEAVSKFFRTLRILAETRLAEIQQIVHQDLEERGMLEPVDKEALMDRVRRREVTVLDVRPQEEYRAGHIIGALSIPIEELEHRLSELPKDREVVAYCRGPYCVLAVRAVELLRAMGFQATRLEDGVLDLRLRGMIAGEEL